LRSTLATFEQTAQVREPLVQGVRAPAVALVLRGTGGGVVEDVDTTAKVRPGSTFQFRPAR
jgi:hypothetical protein